MYFIYLMLLAHIGILLFLIQNLVLSYKKCWLDFFWEFNTNSCVK